MRTNQPSDSSDLHQLERRLQGIRSETAIAERLKKILNDRFILLRNQHLPGQWGDIDQILIGPPGVLVIEIKDYTGHYRATRDEWIRITGGGEQDANSNPIRQARNNAGQLRRFLNENGNIDSEIVQARVVMANAKTRVDLDNPAVYFVFANRLEQEIRRWAQVSAPVLTPAQVNSIARLLGYQEIIVSQLASIASAQRSTSMTQPISTPYPVAASSSSPSVRRSISSNKYLRNALVTFAGLVTLCICILLGSSMFALFQATPTTSQVQSDPNVARLNDLNAQLQLVEVQLSDAYTDKAGKEVKPPAGNQFIWARVSAEAMNQPGQSILFPPVGDFHLLDGGQEIRPLTYLQELRPGYAPYLGNRYVKPGDKEEGWILFQLPINPNGGNIQIRLKTTKGLFSNLVTYTWTISR